MNPYYNFGPGIPPIDLGTPNYGPFGVGTSPSVRVTGAQPGATFPPNIDLGGVGRPTPQAQLADYIAKLRAKVSGITSQAQQTATNLRTRFPQAGAYTRTALGLAAAAPAIGTSIQELQSGRPVGALTALAPAGLSVLGARLINKGPLGAAAGLGLMGLGAILPGAAASGAEALRQDITGKPTTGKENEFQTQVAMQRQLSDLGLSQFRTQTGIETSAVKDLSKFYSDQAYLDLQRNLPLINQMKNADLVRQQSLIASQGNQLARLNVLESAGQLALGGQAQTGETVRTMLTSNPYANAVLR